MSKGIELLNLGFWGRSASGWSLFSSSRQVSVATVPREVSVLAAAEKSPALT